MDFHFCRTLASKGLSLLKVFCRKNHHQNEDGGAGVIAWYINQVSGKIGDIVRVIQTLIWMNSIFDTDTYMTYVLLYFQPPMQKNYLKISFVKNLSLFEPISPTCYKFVLQIKLM